MFTLWGPLEIDLKPSRVGEGVTWVEKTKWEGGIVAVTALLRSCVPYWDHLMMILGIKQHLILILKALATAQTKPWAGLSVCRRGQPVPVAWGMEAVCVGTECVQTARPGGEEGLSVFEQYIDIWWAQRTPRHPESAFRVTHPEVSQKSLGFDNPPKCVCQYWLSSWVLNTARFEPSQALGSDTNVHATGCTRIAPRHSGQIYCSCIDEFNHTWWPSQMHSDQVDRAKPQGAHANQIFTVRETRTLLLSQM